MPDELGGERERCGLGVGDRTVSECAECLGGWEKHERLKTLFRERR